MSERDELAVAGARPAAVLSPTSLEELRDVVRAAASDPRANLVPAAGRTALELGGVPAEPFALLDLSRLPLDGVRHEASDLIVECPAWMPISLLNDRLAGASQWVPLDPPLSDRATVGGTLAAALAGPSATGYGLPRDLLLGATLLRSDGELVRAGGRVVKNVAGFDLLRLWCGSLGTLGVLVHVTLRTYPRPDLSALACDGLMLAEALDLSDRALRSGARLRSCEVAQLGSSSWSVHLGVERRDRATLASLASWSEGSGPPPPTRDVGFRPDDALTLRASATRRQLLTAAERLVSAGAAAAVVRPALGSVRATWSSGRLPDLPGFSRLLADLRTSLAPLGGFVIVERMPGEWRGAVDPWGPAPPAVALMRRVKAVYDPGAHFARGRFVDGI